MKAVRHLFHAMGWHRFCQPAWKRVAATANANANATTVVLFADTRRHS